MTIDCTLSKLVIPGFPEMVPEFGTKKADGVSSTAREAAINAMLPFARQRPFSVTEDSGTSEIQAHTPFAIQADGITLTLGNGGFVGCKARVFNVSGGEATVVFGTGAGFTAVLAGDEDVKLEWSGTVWKRTSSNGGNGSNAAIIVGEYRYFSRQLTPLALLENRLLELNYQLIENALYQELCAVKWVGAADNNAWFQKQADGSFIEKSFPADGTPDETNGDYWKQDWWYKCDDDGTRNPAGLYMRVEDARGLFFRNAGQNAVKKGSNDTPYDGGAIGSVEGFGAIGMPDYSQMPHVWYNGTSLLPNYNSTYTVDRDGYVFAVVSARQPSGTGVPGLLINGIPVDIEYSGVASTVHTGSAIIPVRAGNVLSWRGHTAASYDANNSWALWFPSIKDRGSISTNVYMSY
jgi:hypothetical protein